MSDDVVIVDGVEYPLKNVLVGIGLLNRCAELHKGLGSDCVISICIRDKSIFPFNARFLSRRDFDNIISYDETESVPNISGKDDRTSKDIYSYIN